MDVFEAIHTRQSIGSVKPDPVPRELIEQLLAAGAQAPNHYKVRPWRFFVIEGEARQRLGDAMARALLRARPDAPPEAAAVERAKALRAPVILVVAVDKPNGPKVVEIENVAAAAAAAQNILLAAHALGLGAKWRTGSAATCPEVKQLLGLEQDQHLLAFLYVGYPVADMPPPVRPAADDRTTWLTPSFR